VKFRRISFIRMVWKFRLIFAFYAFMEGIKNLIFDLGGVLLNINYHATSAAFRKLGVTEFDELYSQASASQLFESLETGEISEENFYQALQRYCAPGTTRSQMEEAWNAILLDWRPDSLRALENFKSKYRLFLLSNTNSIHHRAFNATLLQQAGKRSLEEYFTISYYSHLIQKRKPYLETFEWVLRDGDMLAAETLFIDDSVVNINGAREAGIRTHLLLPGEKLADLGL
jgi:FMN phosphatase YigB (HAD superfamily)